jgi:branched-chain amino acid transport system substrate-binding protein
MKAFIALLTFFIGVTGIASAQDVHVGFVAPLTGSMAAIGRDALNGVRMAAEEINRRGGIAGRKVVIVEGDDRGTAKDAANVTQLFVQDSSIVAMTGGVPSTATFGAVSVAQRGKLPFVIVVASHPDLTKQGDYIFRNSITQDMEGPALARLLTSCLNPKKIAVMHINNDWGMAMTASFLSALKATGISVVVDESYNPGDSIDYTPKLAKIRAADPDLIWFGSQYNDLGLILKQAHRMDFGNKPFVGSAGAHSSGLFSIAGPAANGLYLHTMFLADDLDPRVQNFVRAYKETHGKEPDYFSAQSYDSMLILGAAIEAGQFDRTKIKHALENVSVEGVLGKVAFDPGTHEAKDKKFIPVVVKDGKFTRWSECSDKMQQAPAVSE